MSQCWVLVYSVCMNILIECVHVQLFHTYLMANVAICFSKLNTQYSYVFHVYKKSMQDFIYNIAIVKKIFSNASTYDRLIIVI